MKVISPTDTTHVIKLIPRFYEIGLTITLNILDEATQGSVSQSVTTGNFTVLDRYVNITFTDTEFSDLDFYNNGEYQIKLTDVDSGEILYRGKMIATDQTPQDYKLTNDLYS
jgi:hypothetical protein